MGKEDLTSIKVKETENFTISIRATKPKPIFFKDNLKLDADIFSHSN